MEFWVIYSICIFISLAGLLWVVMHVCCWWVQPYLPIQSLHQQTRDHTVHRNTRGSHTKFHGHWSVSISMEIILISVSKHGNNQSWSKGIWNIRPRSIQPVLSLNWLVGLFCSGALGRFPEEFSSTVLRCHSSYAKVLWVVIKPWCSTVLAIVILVL